MVKSNDDNANRPDSPFTKPITIDTPATTELSPEDNEAINQFKRFISSQDKHETEAAFLSELSKQSWVTGTPLKIENLEVTQLEEYIELFNKHFKEQQLINEQWDEINKIAEMIPFIQAIHQIILEGNAKKLASDAKPKTTVTSSTPTTPDLAAPSTSPIAPPSPTPSTATESLSIATQIANTPLATTVPAASPPPVSPTASTVSTAASSGSTITPPKTPATSPTQPELTKESSAAAPQSTVAAKKGDRSAHSENSATADKTKGDQKDFASEADKYATLSFSASPSAPASSPQSPTNAVGTKVTGPQIAPGSRPLKPPRSRSLSSSSASSDAPSSASNTPSRASSKGNPSTTPTTTPTMQHGFAAVRRAAHATRLVDHANNPISADGTVGNRTIEELIQTNTEIKEFINRLYGHKGVKAKIDKDTNTIKVTIPNEKSPNKSDQLTRSYENDIPKVKLSNNPPPNDNSIMIMLQVSSDIIPLKMTKPCGNVETVVRLMEASAISSKPIIFHEDDLRALNALENSSNPSEKALLKRYNYLEALRSEDGEQLKKFMKHMRIQGRQGGWKFGHTEITEELYRNQPRPSGSAELKPKI